MQRIERESLTFHQLLTRGVDHGLQVDFDDPALAASDEVYRLARARPIETEQTDLIGLCEHAAALAEIVTWCLRTGPAWVHPDPLPNWEPSSWAIPGGLRRIVLCDHWDERRALQEMRDWRTLEGALYGKSMTILAVQLGAMRDGRRHGPLTKGLLHPRSQQLRFRRRDGLNFSETYEPVWREHYEGTREDWIEAMNADGLMTETFVVHPAVEWDDTEATSIRSLAHSKLEGIRDAEPERSLSRCFDSVRPCEYRFPCAYFKEPEAGKGFVQISGANFSPSLPPQR